MRVQGLAKEALGDDEGEPAGRRRGGGWQAQITAASPSMRAWARQPPVGGLALLPAGGPYSSWYSRQKAPIWITSPSCSLRGASTLSLFTHTPLKEFVSRMA